MIKIIVWGMGKTAKRFQRYLRGDRAEITAFTCSDVAENIGGGGNWSGAYNEKCI